MQDLSFDLYLTRSIHGFPRELFRKWIIQSHQITRRMAIPILSRDTFPHQNKPVSLRYSFTHSYADRKSVV